MYYFIDTILTDTSTGNPLYKTPIKYKRLLSLDWRVSSAKLVLNEIKKKIKVDTKKIAVLGISEGFQVGAKLVSVNKNITHALLMVGNGLSQFYDFIIQNRINAQIGIISEEEAQKNIDSLQTIYKDICRNGNSTEKEWYGHTYLRWNSFCQNQPVDNILSVNIPVYIVASANDKNTTVLSTDYLYLQSVLKGKNNINYLVYPYDHSFNEFIEDENGNTISSKNHLEEVLDKAIIWLNNQETK